MIIPYLTQIKSPFFSKDNTGLGNALFQIFTAYGLSKKYNHTFNNVYLIELIKKINTFDLNHDSTIFRNLKINETINVAPVEHIGIHENNDYYSLYDTFLINEIKKLNNDKIIILYGFFQSHLYFDEYYNDIIKLISPDEYSINHIKKKYNHLFDDNIINISLHFRVNWGQGKIQNLQYNYNYYYDSIKYIENILKNKNIQKKVILNIFGDDIHQIKIKFTSTKYQCIYFDDNPDYIDLWCMSLCKFNVISHSTLSWWGAYLNVNKDKIVIYPEDILRLFKATIHNKPMLPERKIQHYKSDWIPLKTKNVIFQ